jgi:hypothetical protein
MFDFRGNLSFLLQEYGQLRQGNGLLSKPGDLELENLVGRPSTIR